MSETPNAAPPPPAPPPLTAWPVIATVVERLHVRQSWEELLIDTVSLVGHLPGVRRVALYIADGPGAGAMTLAASAGFADDPPAMLDADPGQNPSEAVRHRLSVLCPEHHPAAAVFSLRVHGSSGLGSLWIDAPAPEPTSWNTLARLLAGWVYASRDLGERILRERRRADRRAARALLDRLRPPPADANPIPGARLLCRHWSCRDVGGDFWDLLPDDDGGFFAVGECTGSGLPTALDIADLLHWLRGAWPRRATLADALAGLNRRLIEHAHRGRLANVCLGRVERSRQQMRLVRAGGLSTFWRAEGLWHDLAEDGGAPLGVLAELPVKELLLPWNGDQALICCTDGVYQPQELGREGLWQRTSALCRLITPGRDCPDTPWGALLAERLAAAFGDQPPYDDATIFSLEGLGA